MKQKSGELLDHVASVIENKRNFRRLFYRIAPPDKERISVPGADIRLDADILKELEQTGIGADDLRIATVGVLNDSDAKFSGKIAMAKQLASVKRCTRKIKFLAQSNL